MTNEREHDHHDEEPMPVEHTVGEYLDVVGEYKKQARRSRAYILAALLIAVAIASGALAYAHGQYSRSHRNAAILEQIQGITKNSNEQLRILRDATSPEAVARSQALVANILLQIKCDQRATAEKLIHAMEQAHSIRVGSVRLDVVGCAPPSPPSR